MKISSPIKDSVGKKEGNVLVFSCQTNSQVFSPLKGKTTSGTTTTAVEILSEDNNYILQVYNVTNNLGSDKSLELGTQLGTSKEDKITLKLFKKDGTQLDASLFYTKSSSQDLSSDEGDENQDAFVEFMTKATANENFNLEITRIKQLLK